MNYCLSFLVVSLLSLTFQGRSQGNNKNSFERQSGVVRKNKKDVRRVRQDREKDYDDSYTGHIYTGYVAGFPTISVKGHSNDWDHLSFNRPFMQSAVLGFQCSPHDASPNLFVRFEAAFSAGRYTGTGLSLRYPTAIATYSVCQYMGVLGADLYYSVPNLPLSSRMFFGGGVGLTAAGYNGNKLVITQSSMKPVTYADYFQFGLTPITFNLQMGLIFNEKISVEVRKTFPFDLSMGGGDPDFHLSMSYFGIGLLYHFNTPAW
jgi:hypothetical protein